MLLRTLEANLKKRGQAVLRVDRATSLIMKDGRCQGVQVETSDGMRDFAARGVLIADGGFQADLDLLGRHIARVPSEINQRGGATGCGDGLKMAEAAGAALSDLGVFYGHLLSRDALASDQLWPYPILDHLAQSGLIVDQRGQRLVDEGRGGVAVANAIARLNDPLSTVIVFDQTAWETAGRQHLIPPNPNLIDAGGTVHQAPDIPTLARIACLLPDALSATVAAFNAAIGTNRLADLAPPRDVGKGKPLPVQTPPFYAVPICAGITYT